MGTEEQGSEKTQIPSSSVQGSSTITMEKRVGSAPMDKLDSMVSPSALYDGQRDDDDYTGVCLPGTRERYLQHLSGWAANGPSEKRVEWVSGAPGAGKTAMIRSFCDILENRLYLPAPAFFIWNSDNKRNSLQHLAATIASQLARWIPALADAMERAIAEDRFLLQSTFKKQMEKLIIIPLLNNPNAVMDARHIIIVVDGLDECTPKGQQEFLDFIPYLLSRLSSLPISLLVSSRPELQITGAFQEPELSSITRATEIGESKADIEKFLVEQFAKINRQFPYLKQRYGMWPSQFKRDIMIERSSGLFIWPTVAISYLKTMGEGKRHNDRLELVLSDSAPDPWTGSPLDKLYLTILKAHAPKDRTSAAFLRFKRRLALLCLPVHLERFVYNFIVEDTNRLVDLSETPVVTIFEETADEVWDSVADLVSLFSPRTALRDGRSPLPILSHRTFRDFTFNRKRCGDEFFYCSETELHTEVVCKVVDFFNSGQAYGCEAMSAEFINRVGPTLRLHLEKTAPSEELKHRLDDMCLNHIPRPWPIITQLLLIENVYGGIVEILSDPKSTETLERKMINNAHIKSFAHERFPTAEKWDFLLTHWVAFSEPTLIFAETEHSVYCWQVARSFECKCIHTFMRYLLLHDYQFRIQAFVQEVFNDIWLPNNPGGNVWTGTRYHHIIHNILIEAEQGEWADAVSSFIPVRIDYWISCLLDFCQPYAKVLMGLIARCTSPLPNVLLQEGFRTPKLIDNFLKQMSIIANYRKRGNAYGLRVRVPRFKPVKIPDQYWDHAETREALMKWDWKKKVRQWVPRWSDYPPETEHDFAIFRLQILDRKNRTLYNELFGDHLYGQPWQKPTIQFGRPGAYLEAICAVNVRCEPRKRKLYDRMDNFNRKKMRRKNRYRCLLNPPGHVKRDLIRRMRLNFGRRMRGDYTGLTATT